MTKALRSRRPEGERLSVIEKIFIKTRQALHRVFLGGDDPVLLQRRIDGR
jgi:hypothetical protein